MPINMSVSYHNSSPLEEIVKSRFKQAKLPEEYRKAMLVRSQALELSSHYGLDRKQVSTAALLHNISHLIPEKEYVKLAEEYGVEICQEERENPQLLHQKISRIIAVEEFNISDKEVLNAISCHTTLRKSASLLDKIIFLASKQNNQQLKDRTFFNHSEHLSEQTLNSVVYSCLFNLVNSKKTSGKVHPWSQEALNELKPVS